MISDQELLRAVKEATSEEFVVYGELGREKSDRVALLAMENATGELVVLIVTAASGADGSTELGVDVQTQLDGRVPDGGTFCASCGTRLRPWGRFCQNCGTDATGQAGSGETDNEAMRSAVREAISDDYDFLGEMPRKEGGGLVFFAREKDSGRIAALRLNKTKGSDDFELGETMILKKPKKTESGMTVSVTQMLRRLDADTPQPASLLFPPPRKPKKTPVETPRQRDFEIQTPQREAPPPAARMQQQPAPAPKPAGPTRDIGAEAGAFVKKNRGVLVGVGVGAVLAALAWVALNG
jgi:hypothetical protein